MKILLIEDNLADARLLRESLDEGGLPSCQLAHAIRLADGLQLLGQETFDVVFLDLSLPDAVGVEIVATVQQRAPAVPIVVLTGSQDEQLGVGAIRAGAQDYLVKRKADAEAVCRAVRYAHERKQLEERLLHKERLETAGRIARQVADDFNNLLVPLVGYPELIKLELPAAHRAVAFCDLMQDAAQQMASINENLLALTQRGRLAAEPTDVNDSVMSALASLTGLAGVTIETNLADDLVPVLGVAKEISRISQNLVRTALDALPGEGTVVVRTSRVNTAGPVGRDGHIPPGCYVCLDVSYSGSEIPDGIEAPMFESASSLSGVGNRRGAGLDLNVARALLGDHHGFLDLAIKPGRVVTLSAFLPVLIDHGTRITQEG